MFIGLTVTKLRVMVAYVGGGVCVQRCVQRGVCAELRGS